MTSIKTLLVSQWFTPEPVHVPLSIARELRSRGETVSVLTAVPNYPDGVVVNGYSPWSPSSERIDDFPVHRTPVYPSHDGSALKRMLTYGTWAVSSTVLGARRIREADVALVYSSPATAALAPALWGRLLRTPYVLLIQDLWPDSVTSSQFIRTGGMTRFLERVIERYVAWTYSRAAHVVIISPGMRDVMVARGVDPEKISLVYNWSSNDEVVDGAIDRTTSRQQLGIAPDAFVVTYAGNHGAAQGLRTVIDAAVQLRNVPDVQFVFAGDGTDARSLRDLVREQRLENVRFLGRLSLDEMPGLRAASDVQLVSLIEDDLFAVTMPSKVQSILAAGEPLIVMAPGDAADVVRTAEAGWAVWPGNPAALAAAVLDARSRTHDQLAAMAASGRDFYERMMSKDVGGPRLDLVLRRAAAGRTHFGNRWRTS
jgi:colanic acid biosynthesis glycosyl transferase WcaI